jgi:hypothetical protein
MNSGAILNRINFGMALAGNRIPGVTLGRMEEVESLRAAPRERQVDAIVTMMLGGSVSPETRAVLLSGENPLARRDAEPVALSGLAQVVGLAIGSPEFQRR